MSKKEIELEGKVDLSQAASFLEGLLEGIGSGSICLEKGTDSIVLKPEQEVEIEIKGSQKKDKEKISFEISWEKMVPEKPEEIVEFRISSAPEGMKQETEDA